MKIPGPFANAALFLASLLLVCSFIRPPKNKITPAENNDRPKIVNIINFIRLLEPRDSLITEDVLYQTVVKQVAIMKQYKLPGTFLLQYDALMDSRYQNLLKSLSRDSFEIGAWWEIPQPLVENAGLVWKGRYPWDWHADVGFSTGYMPEERKKLVDVYMSDFKKIFGYYPKSVGSWFIDAYTLNYLYEKYKIVASSNCKDQLGTDGYTLWGGYWSQAYYPSKINSYMPAQHEDNQIPVPIFRMLGSDPVRQYDDKGSGSNGQGVITLEPVYKFGGGDSAWVNWYFKQFVNDQPMEFAYTQSGQENSFTWDAMSKGYELQMPLIARLRDEHKIIVQTLASSGEWFRKNYKTTPATAVTVTEDIKGSDRKTVWFNSRFYRLNLLWENNQLRFRDIHLFDEKFPSVYTKNRATSNECSFFTLPFVDGYVWSSTGKVAGLRFKARLEGHDIMLEGGDPTIENVSTGKLRITWPLKTVEGVLEMNLDEQRINITVSSNSKIDWYLDLTAGDQVSLPFTAINAGQVNARFQGMDYRVRATKGTFSKKAAGSVFQLKPARNTVELNLSGADISR